MNEATNALSVEARLGMMAQIVTAAAASRPMSNIEITDTMSMVNARLLALANGEGKAAEPTEKPKPAVDPKKSIDAEYIVCLEDGRRFKSLKRHLTKLGMTPDEYREKWGLAVTYPMVAPNYAKRRSQLAKDMGLGRNSKAIAKPA